MSAVALEFQPGRRSCTTDWDGVSAQKRGLPLLRAGSSHLQPKFGAKAWRPPISPLASALAVERVGHLAFVCLAVFVPASNAARGERRAHHGDDEPDEQHHDY